jgi:hypothetical protein
MVTAALFEVKNRQQCRSARLPSIPRRAANSALKRGGGVATRKREKAERKNETQFGAARLFVLTSFRVRPLQPSEF